MRVKIIITANIKKPKVGDSYGDFSLEGRSGYFEYPIKEVRKNGIIVGHTFPDRNTMIDMKNYVYKNVMNNSKRKIKIILKN